MNSRKSFCSFIGRLLVPPHEVEKDVDSLLSTHHRKFVTIWDAVSSRLAALLVRYRPRACALLAPSQAGASATDLATNFRGGVLRRQCLVKLAVGSVRGGERREASQAPIAAILHPSTVA